MILSIKLSPRATEPALRAIALNFRAVESRLGVMEIKLRTVEPTFSSTVPKAV